MKKTFYIFACLLPLLDACTRVSQEIPVQEEQQPAAEVTQMVLIGGIRLWDTPDTKGETEAWANDQTIYIGLWNGTSYKKVTARYNASSNNWNLSYSGNLSDLSTGLCKCYYVVDNNYGGDYLDLNESSVIYADEEAFFVITDNVLQVSATLTPLTGRIKFQFPKHMRDRDWYYMRVHGFSHFTRLDLNSFEFTASETDFTRWLYSYQEDPYFYVWFTNPGRRDIYIWDANYGNNPDSYVFERSFAEEVLLPGSSHLLALPWNDDCSGWIRHQRRIDIANHSFSYIVPDHFSMGGDDAQPVHEVTLTKGYYLCHTETRQPLWTNVTGEEYNPEVWDEDWDKPVFGKKWDQVSAFLDLLNGDYQYTNHYKYRFRLPTEAEWEYAAKGGVYHTNYLYSTTNDFQQEITVAWDGWSLIPLSVYFWGGNDLELFCMSGNVSEWVNDWYDSYPSYDVTDPTGPVTGSFHIKRGGSRGDSDKKFLTTTYRDYNETDESITGFRMVLEVVD